MRICSVCVNVKIRRYDNVSVLIARDRQGLLYRRCENANIQICWQVVKHRPRKETHLHINTYTDPHKPARTQNFLHTEAFTYSIFLHTEAFALRRFTHRSFYPPSLFTRKSVYTDAFSADTSESQFFIKFLPIQPHFVRSLLKQNARPQVKRNIQRATSDENLQEKCRAPKWAQKVDAHFVLAYVPKSEHRYQAPAFTTTVRSP